MKQLAEQIIIFFLNINSINVLIHKIYFFNKLRRTSLLKHDQERKPRLFFGPVPILNNKYWSQAMKNIGFHSETLMSDFYPSICKASDFDNYFETIIKKPLLGLPLFIKLKFQNLILLNYVVDNFDVIHIPFSGLFFQNTRFDANELALIKKRGIKIIVLPYGGDAYQYSKVISPTVRHGLLLSYPDAAKQEQEILNSHQKWTKNADIIITGYLIDAVSRWDILPMNFLTIDTKKWKSKNKFSESNGYAEAVNIIHTPNHRGFKGTEFIINAVNELVNEGLKINLILIEKMQNDEVQKIMSEEADILVEQLLTGYALSGLEGMASGLAVITNLENEEYTRLFRRFSYLNECPILSATPESIKQRIKLLVENPELRKQLGIAGNKYVQKYHSENAAQYMFGKIYDKIWFNKDVDLMNMFHPLKSDSYNNQTPIIQHPLFENKIPEALLKTLNN